MKSFKEIRTKLEEATLSPAQEKKREEIVKSLKKKKEEFVERYGEKWEEVMYATATKLAKEMTEETLVEEEEWVLGFEFEVDYTSKEGRAIQNDLDRKFKTYSGSGSGGAGFDVSFNGSKKELEKAKKYVEKKYKRQIDPKYTNFYQYEGYEVADELVPLEEMSAKDHYRKVMRGGRGKGFVVSSPIDRERYPNREREGLEGPYKSRKSGKIFYYDRKEGKYYDPDSDMYLDVSDVMESVQIDEDDATQRFFKGVHAELKKVMDNKYYREFRASNDGRALDNVINHFGKSRGMRVDKTVKSIIDKYGRNRDEYIKKSFEMAANSRRGFREEVELDEKIDYKYTGTVVRIKRREFAKVHKDFKNDTPGKERMMVLDPKTGGTISVPVLFEETQLDEKNEPTNPKLWKQAIAKAKAKFDVYPSAYANAWASKWYKEQGGGWKKVSEELEEAMSGDKLLGIFNKLKNKDTVEIKFDSGIRKGKDYQKFVVTSGKRTVGKARVERIILKSVDNLKGVAYTLYNRKGNVTLAQGDMGVSIVDIKESVELDEKVDGWIAIYNGKKLEIPNDGKVKGIYGAKQLAIKHFKVPKSKQGMLAISPATNESVELGEAKNPKLSKLSKDAKELLASALNMTMAGVPGMDGPSASVGNLDYFTPDAIDAAIKFLDKNSKQLTPAGRQYAREVVRAMKESVSIDEFELNEGKAWDAITKVKDKNQNQKVHGMIVDAMTANLLHKVHDALNSTNQKKFVAAIDKNAAGLKKMVDFAYKQVK